MAAKLHLEQLLTKIGVNTLGESNSTELSTTSSSLAGTSANKLSSEWLKGLFAGRVSGTVGPTLTDCGVDTYIMEVTGEGTGVSF